MSAVEVGRGDGTAVLAARDSAGRHSPLASIAGDEKDVERGENFNAPLGKDTDADDTHNLDSERQSDTSDSVNLAKLTDPTQRERVEKSPFLRRLQRLAERLSRYNIEGIGIAPITVEQRTSRHWWSPGFIWFSANVNGACWDADVCTPNYSANEDFFP